MDVDTTDDEHYLYEVASTLSGEVWETIFLHLQTRSTNPCEARTPAGLAGPGGDLSGLDRRQVSIHHRMPRKAGGAKHDIRVNTLSRLMLLCGTGNTGCHGHIESHRQEARDNGWLIPRLTAQRTDSTTVVMWRAGRTPVLLDDHAPVYRTFTRP